MNRSIRSLHLVCPTCRHRASAGDRHCVHCGEALFQETQATCPVCDHPLPPGPEPHCGHCGAYIRRSLRVEPPSPGFHHRVLAIGIVLMVLAVAWSRMRSGRSETDCLGGVEPGLAPAAVESRLGHPARRTDSRRFTGRDGQEHVTETWLYGISSTRIPGLVLLFVDGKVVQIGSSRPEYTTRRGLGVGDPVPRAEALYGPGIETIEGAGIRAWRVRQGRSVLSAYFVGEEGAIVFLTLEGKHPAMLPDEPDQGGTGEPEASPLGESSAAVTGVPASPAGTSGTGETHAARPGS